LCFNPVFTPGGGKQTQKVDRSLKQQTPGGIEKISKCANGTAATHFQKKTRGERAEKSSSGEKWNGRGKGQKEKTKKKGIVGVDMTVLGARTQSDQGMN